MSGTNIEQCLSKFRHSRNHAWYWKFSNLSRSSEVMHLRKKSATGTLLGKHNSDYILNLIVIHTDKFSFNLKSKHSFIANRDHYRKLDTKQRRSNCGEPSSTGHIYITVSTFMAQGTSQKLGKKYYKRQNTRNSVMKSSLVEMAT